MRASSTAASDLPSLVMLNAGRINFDGKLDFSPLEKLANITQYDTTSEEQIIERVQGHDIVLNKEMPLPSHIVNSFPPSVKLISELGTGYNNISTSSCTSKSISVNSLPTYATSAMSQQVITSILALSSSLHTQIISLTKNDRTYMSQCHLGPLPHSEVSSKTLGLIGGLGTIGTSVTKTAQSMGMNVISTSSSKPVGHSTDIGVEVVDVERLFKESDYVSIHCPLNKDTEGMVGKRLIEMMKPTAFLINTSRGPILNSEDLIDCLKRGVIAGAALDVYGEGSAPPPALEEGSGLWGMEKVILTPHIGWQRLETRQRIVDMTAEGIVMWREEGKGNVC
ncbi:hypothetical protein TrVE_jg9757 [Triparma verrucosa]|uniref:Glycerate dehydrogenase n=1 Tax=Triparma verrucosa TaxID=1606542 RepID=A0A9W7FLZ2_9STRA|nr:hypothetical protein TrVE_jg9757 [Triparma verrucosa]